MLVEKTFVVFDLEFGNMFFRPRIAVAMRGLFLYLSLTRTYAKWEYSMLFDHT